MLQDVLIARGGSGSDLVARAQPVCAGLLNSERRWLNVGASGDLALDLSQRCTGFLLGVVTTTQLLTLAVNHSCVDRQLVAHDRLAADAACELDASDLRRQLPALSHRRFASRGGFGVGGDEAMDFRQGDPAGGPDLDPCQLACLVADGASDPHQAAPDRPGIAFTYVTDGGLTSPWS
jgi:hypothetical protein